jgi:ATP-dependent DNA helicase RecQ
VKRLTSSHSDNGSIRIFEYQSSNLVVPLVEDIVHADLAGTTGVLTQTNDEALQIVGMLLRKGFPAKLIQANDEFNLKNMLEIRSFLEDLVAASASPKIDIDVWKETQRKFTRKHGRSANFDLCKNLVKQFRESNPKAMYLSDFEVFINESRLEDFIEISNETILVSTIHKAKGKEFDNVFILLENFDFYPNEKKRLLYVGMTRAKNNLTIHSNARYFHYYQADNLTMISDQIVYSEPEMLVLKLTHRDVQLGYCGFVQHRIEELHCGNELIISDEGLLNKQDEMVVKFSKAFLGRKSALENKNYRLGKAAVNFLLLWVMKDEKEDDREIIIVLPELIFHRAGDDSAGSSRKD